VAGDQVTDSEIVTMCELLRAAGTRLVRANRRRRLAMDKERGERSGAGARWGLAREGGP
jgi:hypothetical protein